jgi:hypothetical protein
MGHPAAFARSAPGVRFDFLREPPQVTVACESPPSTVGETNMGLVFGLWLAVLGVLGASSLIIAKRPDAKEMIGKLAPYQGWIGAISALWGVWGIISSVLSLGLLAVWPLLWITLLVAALLQTALGLLLGVGVLKTFIKDAKAHQKMDETIAKLSPYQGTLGLIAIALGLWTVIVGFLPH